MRLDATARVVKDRRGVGWRKGIRAGMATAASLLALAPAAGATTFVVNTTADPASPDLSCTPNPGGCTLRDALNEATSADSVRLPAGTYNVNAQLGELILSGDKLNGAGARTTVIDGGLATRVFYTENDNSSQTPVAPQIAGVTVRRGNGVTQDSTHSTGTGGGIFVSGTLGLVNSQVVGNSADEGGGIGMESGANLVMIGSTVASNRANNGRGGGIYSANEANIFQVVNSTVSGNVASDTGGGIYGGGGSSLLLSNATVASNQAATGGAVDVDGPTFANSILAGNSPASCAATGTISSNHTLVQDNSCALTGTGDIQGVNPGLGALANNGGPTDTRAIGPTSLAINRGAQCQTTDQRGVARPQGGACDIGAFEYVAPRLTVIKRVVNDQGGTQGPADFSVHVRAGATDVAGSPQPGTASGRTYTLAPGAYTVAEDADGRYVASFSGGCSASGVVTLAEGQVKTCTITNSDKPPVVGKVVNALPESGTVKIKLPGRRRFRQLKEGEQIPVGTIIDTLKGRITLIAAANKKGGTATADFYDGIFKLGQTKGSKPITTLKLIEKLTGCKASGKKASAAARRKRTRRLWGNGKGRFRTRGNHSAATVVGTKWLVEDRCDSTLTRVKRGKVSVRDFVKRKTVIVRAGKRYIARAR
jgi:CSLREA domain-containing protein